MKYSLGTNWDPELVSYVSQINKLNNDQVYELFGALSFSIFGAAKNVPADLAKSTEFVENYIQLAKEAGIEFNYLVNASVFPELNTKEDCKNAYDYFLWIEQQKPDIITIGNEKTMDFCQKNFPELKINLSIVLGLRRIEEINRLRKLYPSITRVTLHQTVNRDKESLIAHVENAKDQKMGMNSIEVELLANEICIYDCPKLKEHYDFLSSSSQASIRANDKKFHNWCAYERSEKPIEFLNSCWIRPEDVELYGEIGIDIIKIAGREESTDFLKLCGGAYSKKEYNGNVMNLFYNDWWLDEKPPYIQNKQLNGFIEYLWENNLTKMPEMPAKYNIEYDYKVS